MMVCRPPMAAARATRCPAMTILPGQRNVRRQTAEGKRDDSRNPKLPRTLRCDAFIHPKAQLWSGKSDKALQDLSPPHQRYDYRQSRPDVVEGDDQGTKAKTEKALHERPGATLLAHPGEELDPYLRVQHMGEAN